MAEAVFGTGVSVSRIVFLLFLIRSRGGHAPTLRTAATKNVSTSSMPFAKSPREIFGISFRKPFGRLCAVNHEKVRLRILSGKLKIKMIHGIVAVLVRCQGIRRATRTTSSTNPHSLRPLLIFNFITNQRDAISPTKTSRRA